MVGNEYFVTIIIADIIVIITIVIIVVKSINKIYENRFVFCL